MFTDWANPLVGNMLFFFLFLKQIQVAELAFLTNVSCSRRSREEALKLKLELTATNKQGQLGTNGHVEVQMGPRI